MMIVICGSSITDFEIRYGHKLPVRGFFMDNTKNFVDWSFKNTWVGAIIERVGAPQH